MDFRLHGTILLEALYMIHKPQLAKKEKRIDVFICQQRAEAEQKRIIHSAAFLKTLPKSKWLR